jgi:hypothetical protein
VVVQLPPYVAAVVERVRERWELTLSGQAPRGDMNTILVASRRGVPLLLPKTASMLVEADVQVRPT